MNIEQIQNYWRTKYPTIDTKLWEDKEKKLFFGRMNSHNASINLKEGSLGDLINTGERFLRQHI